MSEQASLDSISSEEESANDTKESSASQVKQDKIRIGPYPYTLPEGWSVTQLGEQNEDDKPICYGILKPGEFVEDGVPMVKIEDLEGNKLQQEGVHKVSEELDEEFSRSRLSGGEVLISIQGTIGRMAVVPDEFEGNISRTIARISPEELNSYWLKNYMLSSPARKLMEALTVGSTRASLNIGELRDFELLTPPLPEQRRIASVLYNVDQAIQKTEEIIEQTQRVKEGLMQDLFTEGYFDHEEFKETPIGKVPKDWEVENLENHIELVSGAHVKSDLVSDDSSLTPYITGPEDFENEGFSVTKFTDEPTKFCEPGDVLVTVKGSGCGKSTLAEQRACISRQLKALRVKNNLDEKFLFNFIRYNQNKLETLAEGSAIPGLSNSHINKMKIPVPKSDEQRKIAEAFENLDNKIRLNKQLNQNLKDIKKGLMQDLLTGEVRTSESVEVLDEVREVEQ